MPKPHSEQARRVIECHGARIISRDATPEQMTAWAHDMASCVNTQWTRTADEVTLAISLPCGCKVEGTVWRAAFIATPPAIAASVNARTVYGLIGRVAKEFVQAVFLIAHGDSREVAIHDALRLRLMGGGDWPEFGAPTATEAYRTVRAFGVPCENFEVPES